jgi:hypothetical protein
MIYPKLETGGRLPCSGSFFRLYGGYCNMAYPSPQNFAAKATSSGPLTSAQMAVVLIRA